MTDDRKLDHTIGAWLEETAPRALPEHVLTATFERTRRSRQDLSLRAVLTRHRTLRLVPAVGSAAVVVLAVLALNLGPALIGPGASSSPTASPSASPGATTPWWPQTSLEEVREAQRRSDAGDPDFLWQRSIAADQLGQNHPCGGAGLGCWRTAASAEIFRRFLVEKLGWQHFAWDEAFAHRAGLASGDVLFIRCAPGGVNPLYPGAPGTSCGPTIDDLRYETVKVSLSQPDRQGPGGLWVVTGWEIVEPSVQVDPPSDAEIAAFLDPFLKARIAGVGAEGYADIVESDPLAAERVDRGIPLLYATSAGVRYERAEFEVTEGPLWPTGRTQLEVRLFAEDGLTVVGQAFSLEQDEAGDLRLVFDFQPSGPDGPVLATTENGTAAPVEFHFLDGLVTYHATHPLEPDTEGRQADRLVIGGLLPDDSAPRPILVVLADPRPIVSGCLVGPAPADAASLAASIASFADFQATAPVAVTIGGRPALRMDVVRPSACGRVLEDAPPAGPFVWTRARLYLVDLPAGPGARVLAVVVAADDDSFETVLSWATPVIESIEFHTP